MCPLATPQPPRRYEKTELSTLALDTMTSVAERTITNVSSTWLRPKLWGLYSVTRYTFSHLRPPGAHRQRPG